MKNFSTFEIFEKSKSVWKKERKERVSRMTDVQTRKTTWAWRSSLGLSRDIDVVRRNLDRLIHKWARRQLTMACTMRVFQVYLHFFARAQMKLLSSLVPRSGYRWSKWPRWLNLTLNMKIKIFFCIFFSELPCSPNHIWYHMLTQKVPFLTFRFSTFAPRITRPDIHNRGDRRSPGSRWWDGPFGAAQGADTKADAQKSKQCVELPLTTK